MSTLPTTAEMFSNTLSELSKAINALEEGAGWLRSDWRPVGSSLNKRQARARLTGFHRIAEAKRAVERAEAAIRQATE